MKINTKIKKVLSTLVLVLLIVGYFSILSDSSVSPSKVHAYSTTCPANLTDQQCLNYLYDQSNKINSENTNIQNTLSQEAINQLNFSEKVNYYNTLISETEQKISELELEIEKNTLEIKLLSEDIDRLENNISTASQEITQLENSIKKRVSVSYKYSTYSAIEMFVNADEIDVLMRKLQYLKRTREKDSELLDSMSTQRADLKAEQEELASKKLDVQTSQEDLEKNKSEVYEQKLSLAGSKKSYQSLLAQSEANEYNLLTQLIDNQDAQNAIDLAIAKKIEAMYQSGQLPDGVYVNEGQMIGRMGNTGCSGGAHLHFLIYQPPSGNSYTGNISPWGYINKSSDYKYIVHGYYPSGDPWTFYAYYLSSGTWTLPLAGGPNTVYLTQTEHFGNAIDMSSTLGAGTPVLAAHSGIKYSSVDPCGGKYVWIEGSNKITTVYLHLQ